MNKKKFLGGLKLLSLLLFGLLFVGSSTECKAYTTYNGRPQLNSGEFAQIIEEIGLNQYWSGDIVETARTSWNNWARNYSEDFILENVAFFRGGSPNTEIGWFLSNGTFSNTLDFYALLPYNGQLSANNVPITSSTTALQIEGYTSWILDSSENRTGMNLFRPTGFYLNLSSVNTVTTRESSSIIVSGRNSLNESVTITINGSMVYTPQLVTFIRTYTIASHTNSIGYDWFFLTHHLQFTNESAPAPTPTPIPSGDESGDNGGGSVDLTETNQKIDDVKDSVDNVYNEVIDLQHIVNVNAQNLNNLITETPSGDDFNIPSSGELLSSLNITPIDDPSANFWLAITDGLFDAFTDDVRYYNLDFLGVDLVLDNQSFIVQNNAFIEFLSIIQTVAFVIVEYKFIRKLVNMFSSGVFSQIMRAYSKIDISDLF